MTNHPDARQHFDGTVLKRRADGSECFSTFLDPGEELLDPAESRAAQAPPPPPRP